MRARAALRAGDLQESLLVYAHAIAVAAEPAALERARQSLGTPAGSAPEGADVAERLLALGVAARFPSPAAMARVASAARNGQSPIDAPAVIVAGGTDATVERHMRSYRAVVLEAFRSFRGAILFGGTNQGIAGLAGDVKAARGNAVRAIGYLPERVPPDATPERDRSRCDELRLSSGDGFSVIEPLQAWTDLLRSGLRPAEVRLLGINGGRIAALEYRIALAFGAGVGIVEHSGRSADALLGDPAWSARPGLHGLPRDAEALRRFVDPEAAR
ncbi:MAG: hypothetical protein QOK40_3552 [Miltoncostaeaceae bacterium]|nr:hypothetical protein [Miltoncostaeaceae bacterium]